MVVYPIVFIALMATIVGLIPRPTRWPGAMGRSTALAGYGTSRPRSRHPWRPPRPLGRRPVYGSGSAAGG